MKLEKTLMLCELSAIEWKKSFSKIYSALLFCVKPSLKSTLFSPAIADIWMNKQTIKQTNQKMFVFAWCVSG